MVGDQTIMIRKYNGPTDPTKLRFEGGLNIILNKKGTSSFYFFSYAHRIYHLDLASEIMEERNQLFNSIPSGDGYALNSGFIIGTSNRAIGIGGFHIDDASLAESNKVFEFDLTVTTSNGATPVYGIFTDDHTYGIYLGQSPDTLNEYVAFSSTFYGGAVKLG